MPHELGANRPSEVDAIRVFIVDDHELLRRGMQELLTGTGEFAVVGEAATAAEAISRVPAARPDVVLLDVRLPDGSGVDVCRQLRDADPGLRVLMVTTFDDYEARLSAALAGAVGFVLKQIRANELTVTIRRVAAGEVLLDPASAALDLKAQLDPRLASLTGQERRILDLIVQGLTNRQIGERLDITEKTVKHYVTSLLAKLGVSRRTEAAVLGFRARSTP